MNGEQNSATVASTKQMDDNLDLFEDKIGLPKNILNNHEQYGLYLDMTIEDLEKLTPTDCANIGYRLAQFALYIQRMVNKEKAKAKMLNHRIISIIAPNIRQYSGSWDIQKAAAIKDNDAANKYQSELIVSEVKLDRLDFVATGIKNLADQMKSLQFSKQRDEK